ncbi:MAG: hypothetical protein DIZ80_00940 [endosymbiont of Galathealinum brachiosum]|uniref:histidine kinase n=1 Tax=endosymbiont of Galathealinum brachiosum TaxID=2200906 RepID=A0A370DPK8_9GAMM|nr:MAG: hypothetical protein DIZ80_00940 [endosymbiont of Galathealinum brachiosum]
MKPRSETTLSNNKPSKEYVNLHKKSATQREVELTIQNDILNNKLLLASKMENMGLLSAGISHDFNNILHLIIGFSEIAIHKTSRDDPAYNYLLKILKNAELGKHLTEKILSYNRQHNKLESESVLLHHSVSEAIELVKIGVSKKITIVQNLQNTGKILADQAGIFQIVMNLCLNAIHAMKVRGGLLSIDLNLKNHDGKIWHLLEIKDTGHGMKESTMKNIFDPLFTTKPETEGTGLGLPTVYNIISQYQGIITVTSDFGSGSCFSVLLPIDNY